MKSNAKNDKNFIQTVLESGAKRLGIDAITLYPYDATIDKVGIPFTYGLYELDAVRGPTKETGVAMRAFRLGQAHFAPNAPDDELMASGQFVERENICSSASFPLRVENRGVGLLFVNYRTPHDFDERERITLEFFANEVAIALDNARLSRESEAVRSLHDMAQDALAIVDEKTLLNTLLNKVKDAFDFDTVAIYWVDKDKEEIFRRYAAGLAENWFYGGGRSFDEKDIFPYVVRTRQSKIIEGWDELLDREVYEACGHENLIRIFLPLVIDNKAEGVLEAGNERVRRHFISPGEQRALFSFVNQACLAIEKARRAKESAILVEIGKTLSSNMDLKALLENITVQIRRVVPYENCVLYLIDSDGETVRPFHFVVKRKELEEKLKKFVGKIGEGYTGLVIQTGEGKIIDIGIDEKPEPFIGAYKPEPASVMIIPLKVQDNVIGTINMDRGIKEPIQMPFQQHEFNLASIIASQAAIVIENFRRYQRIFNITEQLQSVQNIEDVYNRVMDGIMKFGYDRARLYLLEDDRYLVSVVSRGMGDAATKFDNGGIRIDLQVDEWFEEVVPLKYKPWTPVISRLDESRRNPWPIVVQEGAKGVRYLDSTPFEKGYVPYQEEIDRVRVKEWIDLPLVVGDKPTGVIVVDNKNSRKPFSDDDFFILTQLSRHAASTIEGVKLLNQTQQHLRELELLKEQISVAIRKMQQTTNLDEILNAILDGVQALGYKRVRLYKYSEEKHAFVGWKALGPKTPLDFEGYEMRLADDPYAREIYESPEARIHTLEKYGDTPARKYLNKSEDTIWVSVPLVVGGKVYGQVNADNEGENWELSLQDLELLDILAAHAALAISNAQAFDEMKRAQDNLRVMTHGVAHSLKNPLFQMRLTLDLIKRKMDSIDGDYKPGFYHRLDSIHKEIADGINGLLILGRLEKSVPEAVNVRQLVSEAFRRYSSIFQGEFEFNIPEDFTSIANAEQLLLAFDSIIKNAVDVMSKDDKLVVSAYASANESVIEFYNTGPSIPEELFPKLGKEIQSLKGSGSGTGLLIVNKIMELHNGDWNIENVPEGGVKVTLKLPVEGTFEK